MPRRRRTSRRKRGVTVPLGTPAPVGITVEQVNPVQGWVVVQEQFSQDQTVERAGVTLEIVSVGTPNTTYGKVRRIHPETAKEVGVDKGDLVVYREWEGGRWDLAGEVVLVLESRHILGLVE